jgi:3-hydroxyacyl-[acyl-carrier-protein] dehydratase
VLMLESLVQASAWLMRITEDFRFSTILLKEAKALKFSNFMKPGMTLKVTSTVQKRSDREYVFKAEGIPHLGDNPAGSGNPAVSARITLEQRNLAENTPAMGKADLRQIAEYRTLWTQVWSPEKPQT